MIHTFKEGLQDGIPIALGYLSVSFTFGMMAVGLGLSIPMAVMISLTNLTSAGQFAGLEIMMLDHAYIQMALTEFIINLRYALMSLSLTQKIEPNTKTKDRMIMAFAITDEIFAVASNKEGKVGKTYFLGLALLPILGWSGGTLLGACVSTLLPDFLSNALQLMIYGMFLAIIIPPAKKDKRIVYVILLSVLCSCTLNYINNFISIGSGFIIIISTCISAGIISILCPLKEEEL